MITYWEHMVADYVGISMLDVEQLDYIDYLIYRRDAFISMMNKTEEGRKYLDNAYRIEQTEPERKKLRDQFGEGE